MNFSFGQDSRANATVEPAQGVRITFAAKEIRRERTGHHANVAIVYGGSILAFNTFNIGRDDERGKLTRSAYSALKGDPIREAYSVEAMKHDLDQFCIRIINDFELSGTTIDEFSGDRPAVPIFPLFPYVLEDAGTILYSLPGKGKSWMAHLMAQLIANGKNGLWKIERRPVLYVNIERPKKAMDWRDYYLCQALGIEDRSLLKWIHKRGSTIKSIAPRIKHFAYQHPNAIVFLDSISRTGLGSLNDDETANQLTDIMNDNADTWTAVAHAAKSSGDSIFGSVHFQAGCDLAIRLLSERQENRLGIGLKIEKSNDIPDPGFEKLVLEFEPNDSATPAPSRLQSVRRAGKDEFPNLTVSGSGEMADRIREVLKAGALHIGEIAEELGIPPDKAGTVRTTLSRAQRHKQPLFQSMPSLGRGYWGNAELEE